MKSISFWGCIVLFLLSMCLTITGCVEGTLDDGDNTEQGKESKSIITLDLNSVTATTAILTGTLDLDQLEKSGMNVGDVGFIYAQSDTDLNNDNAQKVLITSISSDYTFSKSLTNLSHGTKYQYATFLHRNGITQLGEVQFFETEKIAIDLNEPNYTATTAEISGKVSGLSNVDRSQITLGILYSAEQCKVIKGQGTKITPFDISDDCSLSFHLDGLSFNTKYYYCSYVKQGEEYVYGEENSFTAGAVTLPLAIDESSITATTVTFNGSVQGLSDADRSQIAVGML